MYPHPIKPRAQVAARQASRSTGQCSLSRLGCAPSLPFPPPPLLPALHRCVLVCPSCPPTIQQARVWPKGTRVADVAQFSATAFAATPTLSWPMLPRRDSPMASAPRAPLGAPARAVYKALLKAGTPPSLSRAGETHVSAAASLTPQPSPRGPQQRGAGATRQARESGGVLPWTRGSSSALDCAGASPSAPTPALRAATRFEEDWARRQPSEWDALCHEVRSATRAAVFDFHLVTYPGAHSLCPSSGAPTGAAASGA